MLPVCVQSKLKQAIEMFPEVGMSYKRKPVYGLSAERSEYIDSVITQAKVDFPEAFSPEALRG